MPTLQSRSAPFGGKQRFFPHAHSLNLLIQDEKTWRHEGRLITTSYLITVEVPIVVHVAVPAPRVYTNIAIGNRIGIQVPRTRDV